MAPKLSGSDPEDLNLPLEAEAIAPSPKRISRAMHPSVATAVDPARYTLSAVATDEVGQAAMANAIGTDRPTALIAGVDKTHRFVLLVPVHSTTPGAIAVRYEGNRATFSLYDVCKKLDRFVPAGVRHFYRIIKSPVPIQVGQVKGYGLVLQLDGYETEPIHTLSEDEKARRRARKDTAAADNIETEDTSSSV
ncbi:MAG TPA: hypothetical protein VD902_13465 [Symbiobacteriaceae bacterium]|nr:hypothetical protein [Symbiobacteriaceae bacterium]